MRRQCGRPGCTSVATVTFSFDATNCVVWLDELTDGTARAGDLCTRHADLLSPPRDWERIDRRPPRPERAPAPVSRTAATPSRSGAAKPANTGNAKTGTAKTGTAKTASGRTPRRRSRVDQPVLQPEEPAWLPRNASEDDLEGVLDASTPLLSRAFGNSRPSVDDRD